MAGAKSVHNENFPEFEVEVEVEQLLTSGECIAEIKVKIEVRCEELRRSVVQSANLIPISTPSPLQPRFRRRGD